MSKPIFYINLHDDGALRQITAKHPTDPPKHGGVWQTYVPANTNLEAALAEVERLNIVIGKLVEDIDGLYEVASDE